ncbi:MAG: 4,5-dihydroxyphthalate decarboxylase [Alphaproteobacteria bacterium]|jgi:4,5-dihydroxyphthalate decarboxylase|nr:4,5-dihydroxyphthalate decarboxylase [Alphaproteobacteria bacterium]
MSGIPITFACGLYDRMLPLYTGDVKAHGIDLNFLAIDHPREIFDRMANNLEFDACEMSSSDFFRHAVRGDCPMVAIPVFPSRVFRHGYITVDRRIVGAAKDLAGKRIGVPLYAMTAAIFIRGLLQHDHGVDLSAVTWVEGGMNDTKPHGAPSKVPLVRPVSLELHSGAMSLNDRLEQGDIAAVIGSGIPKALKTNPNIQRLFPDYRAREIDYYRRTRIFPIMHLVVLRRDVYEQNPFVATSLFNACCEAKAIAARKMRELGTLRYMLPWMASEIEEIDDVFGGDPWPYGIEPNRQTLEALVQYLAEQALIEKAVPVEDLFVPIHGQEAKP